MVNWLSKKTRDAVVSISSSELEGLSGNGKVNIVYHGDINSENGKVVGNLAKVDDYNSRNELNQLTTSLLRVTDLRELSKSTDPSEKLFQQLLHNPSLPGLNLTKDQLFTPSTTELSLRFSVKEHQQPFFSIPLRLELSSPMPSRMLPKIGELSSPSP